MAAFVVPRMGSDTRIEPCEDSVHGHQNASQPDGWTKAGFPTFTACPSLWPQLLARLRPENPSAYPASERPRDSANSTTAVARGCSDRRSTAAANRNASSLTSRFGHPRLPFGHRAVLSRTMVSTRRSFSSASPPLISKSHFRPAAGRDHHCGGHGEAHGARARNDEHRDRGYRGLQGAMSSEHPTGERHAGNRQHGRERKPG